MKTGIKKIIIYSICLAGVSVGILYGNSVLHQRLPYQGNKENFQEKAEPLLVKYEKSKFSVTRYWTSLSDKKREIELSVFVYIPVVTDTQELQDVLPTAEWQRKHFSIVQRKVGGGLASKAVKAKHQLAKNGKSPDTKMPLLVFGPGLGWLPTDYSHLLTSLASRGNIVIAVAGVPISRTVQFPNGTFKSVDRVTADYTIMAAYLSFATNEIIKQFSDKSSRLYSLVNLQKVIVAGHSISGAAGLLAGAKNKKIKAIINLDGDVNETFNEVKPSQPILYITTQPQGAASSNVESWQEDRSEKRRDAAFVNNTSASENSIRLKVPAMYHSDFLDVAALKNNIDAQHNPNNFGNISFSRSSAIIINAISLFIENNFKETTSWESFEKKYSIFVKQ